MACEVAPISISAIVIVKGVHAAEVECFGVCGAGWQQDAGENSRKANNDCRTQASPHCRIRHQPSTSIIAFCPLHCANVLHKQTVGLKSTSKYLS